MKNTILLVMPALIAAFFMSCAESDYEVAYKRALTENTVESYEMFLQNYPDNKKYSEIARVKMDSLAFIRALFIRALKEFAAEKNGIPSAAVRDTNDIQRIVLINENGDMHRNDLVAVKDWRATTVESLVLVGILRQDRVRAGSQSYSVGPPITRYYVHEYLEIYEARTGKRLYNKKFQAARVSFPSRAPVSQTTITGRVSSDQIRDFIKSLKLGPIPRLPQPVFKREALRDPDGNVYTTVRIGSQEWTVENWRSTKYADGTPIPHVAEAGERGGKTGWINLTTGAYCWYNNSTNPAEHAKWDAYWYNNSTDPAEHAKWGALYNWYVVDPKNPKKIAPEGWRVPADEDWDVLSDYLIANGGNWDGSTEGNKIGKALASNRGEWKSHGTPGRVGNDQSSNNSSGFSALPGGGRGTSGSCGGLGTSGGWWSSTERSSTRAWYRGMIYGSGNVSRGSSSKTYGFSLRFVRDLD